MQFRGWQGMHGPLAERLLFSLSNVKSYLLLLALNLHRRECSILFWFQRFHSRVVFVFFLLFFSNNKQYLIQVSTSTSTTFTIWFDLVVFRLLLLFVTFFFSQTQALSPLICIPFVFLCSFQHPLPLSFTQCFPLELPLRLCGNAANILIILFRIS